MDQREAERWSRDPEIIAEVAQSPDIWMDTDRSIHRWNQLFRADSEQGRRVPPWNEWEWPRRLAAHRARDHEAMMEQAYRDIYGGDDAGTEQ